MFSKKVMALALSGLLSISSFSMGSAAGRPTSMATNGMVTTPNALASQAAVKVLEDGGNAVDAAIAAASTLAVVYPHMNSIGGDNFWLIYNAKTKELKGLNASGRSGEKATIDFYKSKGYDKIPARGYLAANTVPGAISGWWEAYQYASKNMSNKVSWNDILKPAVGYAKDGFPVTKSQENLTEIVIDPIDKEFHDMKRFDGFSETFLKPNGEPYKVGEVQKQPDLANTLEIIAKKGADGFYKGEVASKIVNDVQANGGLLTMNDFAQHKSDWVNPISTDYRGYKAFNLPPNTQGMASLSILNILNNHDVKALGEGTADYYHLIIEATKQAFADRDEWLTDPTFLDIPVNDLLSKKHGQDMAKRIDMKKAAVEVKPLDPKGDTVWLGVVDKDGNAVSIIQSVYHEFGAGIVAKDTGVLLQNRGSFFSLDPEHINHLEPKKRTFHTLNPAMLFKDDKPYLVYGTMGGEGQPQTQAAIVTRIVDFGFSVQDAIEAPRWLHGRTWGAPTNGLKVEGRVSKDITDEMIKRGHPVQVLGDFSDTMGHAGAILIDPKTNVKFGGADPRGDGAAVGY